MKRDPGCLWRRKPLELDDGRAVVDSGPESSEGARVKQNQLASHSQARAGRGDTSTRRVLEQGKVCKRPWEGANLPFQIKNKIRPSDGSHPRKRLRRVANVWKVDCPALPVGELNLNPLEPLTAAAALHELNLGQVPEERESGGGGGGGHSDVASVTSDAVDVQAGTYASHAQTRRKDDQTKSREPTLCCGSLQQSHVVHVTA
jgi:hypothetical protein